jgi:uncharacterized membrane protein YfcA
VEVLNTEWAAYLALGAFAGTVAGLLGVGGGLVIVPTLVFLLGLQGIEPMHIVHIAVGTSLATIVITSISSSWAHHRHGAVLWPVFARLSPGIVIGALLGAVIADYMSATILQRVFGVFELLVALQMVTGVRPYAQRGVPGTAGMLGAGGVIGAISSVVGIGGGTMTVPFLVWCNVSMREAVATSAACGLPIAIAGATGFILMGWNETGLPAGASGYIFWPAFFGIVFMSSLFAPLGARLAHRLPVASLKKLFALLLCVLGISMLTA